MVFDSLYGNRWDVLSCEVLPLEKQQQFRFVTQVTAKAKGMQKRVHLSPKKNAILDPGSVC